jgi:hypothetical protein
MTFELLPAAMKKLQENIPKEVNKATQKVAEVILYTAAENTPVDTSKALSNWIVSLNSPANSYILPKVPGLDGSTKYASLAIVIREARAIMSNRRIGVDIHVGNIAPYIDELNNGKSKRAPAGFVQKATLAGIQQQNATKLDLRNGI